MVLGLGALLIGTGVIDTGKTEQIVRQTSVAIPSESIEGQAGAARDSKTMPTVEEIYQADSPGVVFIQAKVTQQSNSPFGFSDPQQGTATGTGFVIDKGGDILTNNHVVEGATTIR